MQALLQAKMKALKPTTTVITHTDGRKFAVSPHGDSEALPEISEGFVVDTRPDGVPALIVPHLYLGSQDCCATLGEYDITHVLSLGVKPFTYDDGVRYEFVEFLDLPECHLSQVLNRCVQFISTAVEEGCNVLVHCNAGVSRSASVVIGYLILVHHLDFDTALGLVKSVRSCVRPNDGFIKQLKELRR